MREGAAYNFVKGTITHDVLIDVCIHPVFNKTGRTDPVTGRNELHIIKCSERNKELNCQYFQPSLGLFGLLWAILTGKTTTQIYEAYQRRHPSRLEKPRV